MARCIHAVWIICCLMLASPTRSQLTRALKQELNKLRAKMTLDIAKLQIDVMDLREAVNSNSSNNNAPDPVDIILLKKENKELAKHFKDLNIMFNSLKKKTKSLQDTMIELSENCSSGHIDTKIENLQVGIANVTTMINNLESKRGSNEDDSFESFSTIMKDAFKSHKHNIISLVNGAVVKLDALNKTVTETKDVGVPQEVGVQIEALKKQLADLTEKVENIPAGVIGDPGDYGGGVFGGAGGVFGGAGGGGGGILGGVAPTTASVNVVTMTPGGPRILSLFKEDLRKAIKVGSRVVRGQDWTWGGQDGNGPGTIMSWYRGTSDSGQVIVKWDKGIKANYRVGAHGKYDLYLLAE